MELSPNSSVVKGKTAVARFWGKYRLPIVLVLVVAVFLFILRRLERFLVYHPWPIVDRSAAELGHDWEEVTLQAIDGVAINAWFFQAKPDSARRHITVLIAHGNGGNLGHRRELYRVWLERGVNVFCFDYRGYGRSQGTPGEEGTYRDAEAAWQWLRARGFEMENILGHGESLGGAVVAELAQRRPLGGLLLQSTFTSVPEMGRELYPYLPVRLIGKIQYDTLSKLPRLTLPVMVMHSRTDTMIDFRFAERLFGAANEPKLLREIEGDHNDQPLTGWDTFTAALEDFLRLTEQSEGGGSKKAIRSEVEPRSE